MPLAPGDEPRRASKTALRYALAAILRRDPSAWSVLPSALESSRPAVQELVLFAAADTTSSRAFAVIADAGRRHHDLEQRAVALVRTVASGADPEERRVCAAWCAEQLEGARPEFQRSLFLTIGAVDDGTLVPELLPWLESETDAVREGASAALRSITGAPFRAPRSGARGTPRSNSG